MKRILITLSLALAALTVHAETLLYQVIGPDGKTREYEVAVQSGSLLQFTGTGLKPLPTGSAFTTSGSLALAPTQAGNFTWTGTHGFASISVGGIVPVLANDRRVTGLPQELTDSSTWLSVEHDGVYRFSGDYLDLLATSAKTFRIRNEGEGTIYIHDVDDIYWVEVGPHTEITIQTSHDSGDNYFVDGFDPWVPRSISDNSFSGPSYFGGTVTHAGRVTMNAQPAITSASSNDAMTLAMARALAEREAMEWVTVQGPPWYNYARGTTGVNGGTVSIPTADNGGNGVGGGITLTVTGTAGSLAVFRNSFYPFVAPGAGAHDNQIYWNAPMRQSWFINQSHVRSGLTSRYYYGVSTAWDGGEISVKGFGFEVTSGTARGVVHNGTSKAATTSSTILIGRRQYKMSAFSDGSSVNFYVNGTSLGSLSAPGGNSSWPNMSTGVSLASDGTNGLNGGGEGLWIILHTASWKSQH